MGHAPVLECTAPSLSFPDDPPWVVDGQTVDGLSVKATILANHLLRFGIATRHERTCDYGPCGRLVAYYVLYSSNLPRTLAYCSAAHAKAARKARQETVRARTKTAKARAAKARAVDAQRELKALRRAAHERNTALKAAKRAAHEAEQERLAAARAARDEDLRGCGARVARYVARLLAATSGTQWKDAIRDVVLEEDEARRGSGGVPAGYVEFLLREVDRAAQEIERARVEERACLDPAWRAMTCPWPEKEAWLTAEGAWAVIRVMREQGRPRAENLHTYHCSEATRGKPGCGGWHVGDWTVHEAHMEQVGA